MLRAVQDKVVVKLDRYKGISGEGLFLADRSATTPVTGIIVAVGRQVKRNATLDVGDRVHCKRYAGTVFTIKNNEEEKFVSLKEDEIECLCDQDWYYDFHNFKL